MLPLLPKLREDLEIIPRVVETQGFRYVLKDPRTGNIFDFGKEEYFFCQQFDGHTSLDAIRTAFEERFNVNLRLADLEAFARKLSFLGLLEQPQDDAARLQALEAPLKIIRLGNPNKFLGFIAGWMSWCFSRFFLIAFIAFMAIGLGLFIQYLGDIYHQMRILRYSWGPIIYLLIPVLAVFIIEPLDEFAKGIACRHYGRVVNEYGILLKYRILPRFYLDISDALWMRDKSDTLRIFSAGLICRLLLWAMSLVIWKNAAAGSNIQIFWLFFILASTFSFLLTLIPLSERAGYQLLSIWKEIENLHRRAVELTKAWLFRHPMPEPLSPREIAGFKWYGVLWFCFQAAFWILFFGIAGYFLTSSMQGVGAFIMIVLLVCRFEHIIRKLPHKLGPLEKLFTSHSAAFIRTRLLVRYGLLIVLVVIALLPYPFMVGGDFRLLPVSQVGIRSHVTGEIETVFVTEGQWIRKGDPVVKLTGRDQRKRVEATQAALDETQARLDLALKGPKPEAVAAAAQEVKTASKSLEYSNLAAARYAKLIKDNATSAQAYENALKMRDLDKERLELAKRNLELVQSGARDEEIDALEAEVRRLKVELRHAKEDLELILLTSPIEGRVITPNLSERIGQVLVEGDLFAVIENAKVILAEIQVPEKDVGEVLIGADVKIKPWGYPTDTFRGKVIEIAPVAYEKSLDSVVRTLSEREMLYGRNKTLKEEGKVVRVLSELPNKNGLLKTDMTGYAKIDCENKPVVVAFTRWLVRFIMIEIWSWIP